MVIPPYVNRSKNLTPLVSAYRLGSAVRYISDEMYRDIVYYIPIVTSDIIIRHHSYFVSTIYDINQFLTRIQNISRHGYIEEFSLQNILSNVSYYLDGTNLAFNISAGLNLIMSYDGKLYFELDAISVRCNNNITHEVCDYNNLITDINDRISNYKYDIDPLDIYFALNS